MIRNYLILGILILSWGMGCAPKPVSMADGKYLQVTNQHDKAIELFSEFLKRHPESPYAPEAQYLIGESYERLNQPQLAIQAYKRVLEKYLKSPYAALSYRQMAKHYAAQGEYKKAIKHYQLAMDVLRSEVNIERCTFAIAQIYQNGLKDYEAALEEYRKLTKDLKNQRITVMAYLNMGKIFKQQGKNNKARAAFQTIVDQYSWSDQLTEAKKELGRLSGQAADPAN